MDIELKNRLKREAIVLGPVAWVGKNGLTEQVKEEIKKQLKNKSLIKVKVLRSFIEENDVNKKDFAVQLAEEVGAELVQKLGFMVILYKKGDTKDKRRSYDDGLREKKRWH